MEAGAIDTRTPMELRALIAGVGAGIVGAAASIAAQVLMRAPYPHYNDTLGSAVAAGVAGGLLYAVLVRLTAAPGRALWVSALAIATVDTLLIAVLPLPAGHGAHLGPFDGLVVPVRQLAALVGVGHFGARHFPAAFLFADTVIHYIPAAAVAVLVPRWAGARRG